MSKLSKSKHPAYHLRPNKAIDRAIFLEMLRVMNSYCSLDKHIYIGFGGPFLEDFRLIADNFPKTRMISIEKDGETYKRQKFHQCSRRLELMRDTFQQFLSSKFPSDYPTVTWLDYIDFDRQSLLEASAIARAALVPSIVRITVKAQTPIYDELKVREGIKRMPSNKKKEFKEFVENYNEKFSIQDVAYDESLFVWENFKEEEYPNLIAKLIYSVLSAACAQPRTYLPVHSVKYSDGTIMLSTTGIICMENEKEEIIKHFKSRCDFFSNDPNTVETIDVPMLTTKERLHLECKIPGSKLNGRASIARLRYLVEGDDSEELNQYKMEQYEKYHRLYPYFGKLIP